MKSYQSILLAVICFPLFGFSLAFAQSFEDHVIIVGNGSGVILNNNNAITARHVIHQMDYNLGENDSPICLEDNVSPIGNYDSYSLSFLPPASAEDKMSLNSGQINYNRLDEYKDWGAIRTTYINGMPELSKGDLSTLYSGVSLVAIGHLSSQKYVNRTMKFVRTVGQTIVFSYDSGSSFGRGFSGGGLFTGDGKLVGIIYAMNEHDNTGTATFIGSIEAELNEFCPGIKP